MTLIELLVVISIMLMLAAYALPKLAPMAKQRKIREAARSVNVFISRARSRAIETGRPCGVVFKRFDTTAGPPLSNVSTMLYQAEVPPPYAGNTNGAAIKLQEQVSAIPGTVILQAQIQTGSFSDGLVKIGDKIQFNNQGPWYEISASSFTFVDDYIQFSSGIDNDPMPLGDGWIDNCFLTLSWQGGPGCVSPWPKVASGNRSAPVPFKILRQPVRTIAQPLSLPVGTTVDLSASGTDEFIDTDSDGILDSPIFAIGYNDVTIIFSPNGSVSRYYCDYGNADATEPIFLLIGWREQVNSDELVPMSDFPADAVPEVDEEKLPNWQLLTNLWITLNPQTGLTSVSENAYAEEAYATAQKGTPFSWNKPKEAWKRAAIRESRSFARRAQSKGGR